MFIEVQASGVGRGVFMVDRHTQVLPVTRPRVPTEVQRRVKSEMTRGLEDKRMLQAREMIRSTEKEAKQWNIIDVKAITTKEEESQ